MSILGTRVVRTEDPRLLTAGGVYVDDLRTPELRGAARVTFDRSPPAHARITGIAATAEAIGCEVAYSEDAPPWVTRPAINNLEEVSSLPDIDPERAPSLAELLKATRLVAARLGDQVNPTKASSGRQFFITLADQDFLDGQYTAFGYVTSGMDAVDKLGASFRKVHDQLKPSVDVERITARIAFQCASRVDSRTILDAMGADKLLGKGDMLFLPPGSSRLTRVHGAFVTENEMDHGSAIPLHTHPVEEGWVVLEGELQVQIGDEWVIVRAGSAGPVARIPRPTQCRQGAARAVEFYKSVIGGFAVAGFATLVPASWLSAVFLHPPTPALWPKTPRWGC